VFSPTNIVCHEIQRKQVFVKDPWARIILLILTYNTWAAHETISRVCLGHIYEFMHTPNEVWGAAVRIVHPLPVHLHYMTCTTSKTCNNPYYTTCMIIN
jgi:hypothetical protein